jgi:hypothetical protein
VSLQRFPHPLATWQSSDCNVPLFVDNSGAVLQGSELDSHHFNWLLRTTANGNCDSTYIAQGLSNDQRSCARIPKYQSALAIDRSWRTNSDGNDCQGAQTSVLFGWNSPSGGESESCEHQRISTASQSLRSNRKVRGHSVSSAFNRLRTDEPSTQRAVPENAGKCLSSSSHGWTVLEDTKACERPSFKRPDEASGTSAFINICMVRSLENGTRTLVRTRTRLWISSST